MHNSLESTRRFMEYAGQEVKQAPGIPSKEVLVLRLSLELEELYEKAQAFGLEWTFQNMLLEHSSPDERGQMYKHGSWGVPIDTGIFDTAAVLDACADQRVVADGTILACGLQDVFSAALDEVASSNMSKFPTTTQEAMDTVTDYMGKGIRVVCDMGRPDGTPMVVTRRADGKALKSIHYRPANMQAVLDAHAAAEEGVYVDPILFAEGFFKDKEDYTQKMGDVVERIQRGEIVPREPEQD